MNNVLMNNVLMQLSGNYQEIISTSALVHYLLVH
jgi:hypothetical protein